MAILNAWRNELTTELKELFNELERLEEENLTEWESEFVEGLQERIIKYRGEAIITPKQYEWVDNLCGKYGIR